MNSNKSVFMHLSRDEQKATLEALIFAADEAASLQLLHDILLQRDESSKPESTELIEDAKHDDVKQEDIETEDVELVDGDDHKAAPAGKTQNEDFTLDSLADMIAEINDDLALGNRPFRIVNVAGGYQFATRPEYGYLVARLNKSKQGRKLSQAALEALSIIAYKQPVSKPEIEQIRGVNSNEIVNSLIDKDLVKMVGRSEALGKPLLFGTTNDFLRVMGLKGLEELPKLRELEDLTNFDKYQLPPEKTLTLDIDGIGGKENGIWHNDDEKPLADNPAMGNVDSTG